MLISVTSYNTTASVMQTEFSIKLNKIQKGIRINNDFTFACSLSSSIIKRSTLDGLAANRGIGMVFVLDTFLPGFWRASSASV